MTPQDRWATSVRVVGFVCLAAVLVAVLEGVAVRRARAELQQVRGERDRAEAETVAAWIRQPADEFGRAVGSLDAFYANTDDGFGRAGGLCPDGHLDVGPIVRFGVERYLQARAAGRSVDAALEEMNTAIRQTDAYRAVHPDLAIPEGR